MNPKSKRQVKKVVLAYSGGLDTSVIVPWLKENYGCEVVCFCADVGQADEDLAGLEQKAIKSGASQFVIHDMKEEFVSDYLFPMLKAGAVYEHKYLLGTSVARPLIAKHLVEVAHETGADAIAHGATGKGNDQVRFELTVMALDPRLKIIAPWRSGIFARVKMQLRMPQNITYLSRPPSNPFTAATQTCGTSRTKAARSKIRGTSPKRSCIKCQPRLRMPLTKSNMWRSNSSAVIL